MKSIIYGEASGKFIKEVTLGNINPNDPHTGEMHVKYTSLTGLGGQVDFLVGDFTRAFKTGAELNVAGTVATPLFLEIFWRKLKAGYHPTKGRYLVLPDSTMLFDNFTASKNGKGVEVTPSSRRSFRVTADFTLNVGVADLIYTFFYTDEIWDGQSAVSVSFEDGVQTYDFNSVDVRRINLPSNYRDFFMTAIKSGFLKEAKLNFKSLVKNDIRLERG